MGVLDDSTHTQYRRAVAWRVDNDHRGRIDRVIGVGVIRKHRNVDGTTFKHIGFVIDR